MSTPQPFWTPPPLSTALAFRRPQVRRPQAVDYSQWSVEELRELAMQLRLPGAASKNRRELIEIFTDCD